MYHSISPGWVFKFGVLEPRLQDRSDYSQSKFETFKFYCVVDYNKNVNSGLEGQRFEN